MLNAKSGIAEMLQPAGGAGAARRQDSGSRESSGLFGDTLKGQMDKTAEGQKPAAREAERPARSEKKTDSAQKSEQRTEPAAEETSAAPAEETVAAEGTADGEEVVADETTPPILTLVPQPVVDKPVTETPELDGAAQAETESGNVLPPALPLVAAETQDAAQVEGGGEADGVELPRWMQALAATGRGREQAAAAQAAQDEPMLSAEGEDGVQEGGFLKGWQAITAQLDSQRGDLGNRQGQGQGAEALFRLAGLAAQKDVAPPPMAMAASTVSSTAASAAPAPVQTLALDVPMRQSGWDAAFAERVVWMAKQGMQEAQISLNPRNMGPIEVHISMQKEQASVTFVAHHAVTRDALEAAMPRLRDMLQDNGLNLAQSDVSQHSFDQRRDQAAGFAGDQGRGQQGRGDGPADDGAQVETALHGGSGLGAVDYYA